MDYRQFGDRYVLRIDRGEEVLEQVEKLCRMEGIRRDFPQNDASMHQMRRLCD